MAETPITTRVSILSDLWMGYRNDEDFDDFISYNDIALPLAYCIEHDIVKNTPIAESFINETWGLLLGALEIDEDTGFDSLDDLLALSEG